MFVRVESTDCAPFWVYAVNSTQGPGAIAELRKILSRISGHEYTIKETKEFIDEYKVSRASCEALLLHTHIRVFRVSTAFRSSRRTK
jgi:hypothetical protein